MAVQLVEIEKDLAGDLVGRHRPLKAETAKLALGQVGALLKDLFDGGKVPSHAHQPRRTWTVLANLSLDILSQSG